MTLPYNFAEVGFPEARCQRRRNSKRQLWSVCYRDLAVGGPSGL